MGNGCRISQAGRVAVAAVLASVAAPAVAQPDREALDALAAGDMRLAAVGYRLAVAAADRCATPTTLTGLVLHDLGQYAARDRAGVAARFAMTDGIGVLGVVPGSGADVAGLRAGDEIVAIGDTDLTVTPAALPRRASYDQAAAMAARLQSAGPAAIRLRLRRAGTEGELTVTGVVGCGGMTVLAPSRVLNAWADGSHVVVTTRLLAAAADDDELAFVVAHEMAHNILKHRERLGTSASGLFAAFGRGAARVKATEIEADAAAVGLMAAAGFRLGGAVDFLARSAKGRRLDLATTHPGVGRRIAIVTAAIDMTPVRPAFVATVIEALAADPAHLLPIVLPVWSPARAQAVVQPWWANQPSARLESARVAQDA